MACIERRPRCSNPTSGVVPEPLPAIGSVIGIIGTLITVGGVIGKVSATAGVVSFAGIAIGSAATAGAVLGFVATLATFVVIAIYVVNRCTGNGGLRECVAGVVQEIVQDFSDAWQELFPFTAMHDRVDVVVKSRFWNVVEDGGASVFCTDELFPRRSEIMRCYVNTPRVCAAATGAMIGGIAGVAGGIIAAAAIVAAIGCATIILCIFALILAAIVAVAAVLVAAFIGGQIGKAASGSSSPTATGGTTIAVGNLITVEGHMERRGYDSGANVMWWVTTSSLSGNMPSGAASNPFSYCEVDDVFTPDGCPTI